MDRKEFDHLSRKARAERDKAISEVEQKYQERLRGLQITWELASTGEKKDAGPFTRRAAPTAEEGPIAFVRAAVPLLSSGFTRNDVARYIATHHGGAAVTAKQVSSALYKLMRNGEVRMLGERRGNAAARYEVINNHREVQEA